MRKKQIKTKNHNESLSTSNLYVRENQRLSASYPQKVEESSPRLLIKSHLFLKRRLLGMILMTGSIVLMAGVWTEQKKPIYEGRFQLLVDSSPPHSSVASSLTPNSPEPPQPTIRDDQTFLKILRSSSVVEPAIKSLQPNHPNFDYQQLIQGKNPPLKIVQLPRTNIIEVRYRDSDRQKIQLILERLAQKYLAYGSEKQQNTLNQGIEFVTSQITQHETLVKTRQAQLEKFRQQHQLLDPQQEAQTLSQQLSYLNTQYRDTQVKLNETLSLYKNLQKQVGLEVDEAIITGYLSESPRYQSLLAQLQEVEVELAQASARFVETSPMVVTIKEKRNNLAKLIDKEAKNLLGSQVDRLNPNAPSPSQLRIALYQQYVETANQWQLLQVRQQSLSQEIQKVQDKNQKIPALTKQYNQLQQEITQGNNQLEQLLLTEQQLKLDAAQQINQWQIITPPTLKDNPVAPNWRKNLGLSAVFGILFSLTASWLLERLNPVIYSLEDLKSQTFLPLLGTIPKQTKGFQASSVNILPSSPYAWAEEHSLVLSSQEISNPALSRFTEAFHSLATHLWLLGAEKSLNSWVISSVSPREGTSTVAINLSLAIATMGQRVLLVDANLHSPQVHHLLGITNDHGLGEVLTGRIALETAIQPIPTQENLSVLTAGNMLNSSSSLVASRRILEFLATIQQKTPFDTVIYDTPSLSHCADGKVLGVFTTGMLLVVREGKTRPNALKQVLDDLRYASVPFLGIVANAVNSKQ